MNKREKQKAETITEILNVSRRLFTEKGFEKTSIQQIAQGCGLSKGALYHHFESKEEVLEEICRRTNEDMLVLYRPLLEEDLPALEKIKRFMTITRESSLNISTFNFPKGSGDTGNAVLEKTLDRYGREIYLEIIAPILEEGRRCSELSFEGSSESFALFINDLDNGVSCQINSAIQIPEKEEALLRIRTIMEGFVYALSRLLGISKAAVSDILQADVLLENLEKIISAQGGDS